MGGESKGARWSHRREGEWSARGDGVFAEGGPHRPRGRAPPHCRVVECGRRGGLGCSLQPLEGRLAARLRGRGEHQAPGPHRQPQLREVGVPEREQRARGEHPREEEAVGVAGEPEALQDGAGGGVRGGGRRGRARVVGAGRPTLKPTLLGGGGPGRRSHVTATAAVALGTGHKSGRDVGSQPGVFKLRELEPGDVGIAEIGDTILAIRAPLRLGLALHRLPRVSVELRGAAGGRGAACFGASPRASRTLGIAARANTAVPRAATGPGDARLEPASTHLFKYIRYTSQHPHSIKQLKS